MIKLLPMLHYENEQNSRHKYLRAVRFPIELGKVPDICWDASDLLMVLVNSHTS